MTGKLGDKIEVTGEATPSMSGKFEVTVDGDLVHTKIGGDGYVDTGAKLQKIVAAIEAKL